MLPKMSDAYTAEQIMMTLAAIAYVEPGSIANYLTRTQYATSGDWSLVWGPAVTEGNLMYVAKYKYGDTYAVSIRGTVLDFSLATLVDLYEDLDVGTQRPWTYPNVAGAAVAQGTLFGLKQLEFMRYQGLTLLRFLSQIPANSNVFVTGHSLGGCLTTVLAPWLRQVLPNFNPSVTIIPFTFAAPSAGNEAFARWYTTAFANHELRCYNQIDMVPMAWASLHAIEKLFPAPGPTCPRHMQDAIALVKAWLTDVDHVTYAQPEGSALAGIPVATRDWFFEVSRQHDHNTYLGLLKAPPVDIPQVAPALAVKPIRAAIVAQAG